MQQMSQQLNLKQVAELLNGVEYPDVISKHQEDLLKANGIVIAFGLSDDLLEFRGSIHGELGASDGTTVYVTENGRLWTESELERANRNQLDIGKEPIIARRISAIWTPHKHNEHSPECSWLITIDTEPGSFETFDIMEDGELYCRGIVFYLDYNSTPNVFTLPEILKTNGVQALDEWCEINLHCRLLDLLPMVRYAIDHPEGYADVQLKK